MDDNPVDRHRERMAQIERDIEEYSHSASDIVDELPGIEKDRYIAELEWIIYTTVNLSSIMREGHSEETYRSIHRMYEPPA